MRHSERAAGSTWSNHPRKGVLAPCGALVALALTACSGEEIDHDLEACQAVMDRYTEPVPVLEEGGSEALLERFGELSSEVYPFADEELLTDEALHILIEDMTFSHARLEAMGSHGGTERLTQELVVNVMATKGYCEQDVLP